MYHITKEQYDEVGTLLKQIYWEYVVSGSNYKNDFISSIEIALSYSDNTINPYIDGNFDVSFRSGNIEQGAKKFFENLKNSDGFSKVASIINKASKHTSNFKALYLLMLPYMFEKLNVTNAEISYGTRLASLITFLLIEHSISVKKSKVQKEEIEQLKTSLVKLEKQFESLGSFEYIDELFETIDNITHNEDTIK